MKFTEAKPFSLDEISLRFEELGRSEVFFESKSTKVYDKEGEHTPPELNGTESPAEVKVKVGEALPRKIVTELVPKLRHGRPYGFKSWFSRVFFTDDKFRPKGSDSNYFPVDYLHRKFDWCVPNEFAPDMNQSVGNYRLHTERVIKYWLSIQFGFHSWKGNVVQVNPAELFVIPYLEKKGDGYPNDVFNKVISEVRLIPLDELPSKQIYNQFGYYLHGLLGMQGSGGLRQRELIPSNIRDHWLARNIERYKYLEGRQITKHEVLTHLKPLGDVTSVGWSFNTEKLLDSKQRHDYTGQYLTLNDWRGQECFRERGMTIFTNGAYFQDVHHKFTFDGADQALPEHLQKLATYLKTFARKSDNSLATTQFKEDLVKFGVYPTSTSTKRSFIKEVVIPDASTLGFEVKTSTGYVLNPSTGDSTKRHIVKISQPKYGRSKK